MDCGRDCGWGWGVPPAGPPQGVALLKLDEIWHARGRDCDRDCGRGMDCGRGRACGTGCGTRDMDCGWDCGRGTRASGCGRGSRGRDRETVRE
jgi:hypothetical protein